MMTRSSSLCFLLVFFISTTKAQQPHNDQKRLGDALFAQMKDKLAYFPYDSTYRVKAIYDPAISKNEPFELPTSAGKPNYFMEFGTLRFTLGEAKYQLKIYRPWPINLMNRYQMFLPFRDETAQQETYPAGRYLPITMDDFQEDGLWLDFNQAVNPFCAYDDTYACPLPPKENHLKVRVLAGEKRPKIQP